MHYLFFAIISLIVLIKSADIFVDQSSSLAHKLKLNDFLIGLTIVAFGTSLPEFVSSIYSSIRSNSDLVISNILGSNIANFCLILGITASVTRFRIRKRDIKINIPLNILGLVIFWLVIFSAKFHLTWSFGISLILILIIILILSRDLNHVSLPPKTYKPYNILFHIISLLALILSGKFCVDSIINLASSYHISQSILGYFLLSIGTSLPELITTWISVRKNDHDLGIGNILGSNLINLLFIFGFASLIHPLNLTNYGFDLFFLSIVTIFVYFFAIIGKKYSFSKKEGLFLLLLYLIFIIYQLVK